MITLYNSGRFYGLPDLSPFVTKTETLLKMAGLEYQLDKKGFTKAPKGKIPYINDSGVIVSDSTFIRFHIEKKYQINFDTGYGATDLAIAWSVERMLEEHLYFALVHARWMIDANFERGPAQIFKFLPPLIRPLIQSLVRRKVHKILHAQGIGRHTTADIELLACRDLDAVSTLLDDKRYLLGDEICGADATLFSFLNGTLCPVFDTPIRQHAAGLPNLVAYHSRMISNYFPELIQK